MRYLEGKMWTVEMTYVGAQAGKVTKRIWVQAPTAEKAMGYAKEAVSLSAQITACNLHDFWDGMVIE